jgi:hypothetical protein
MPASRLVSGFLKDHAQVKEMERDDDSKKCHPAQVAKSEPGSAWQRISIGPAV